MILASRTFPRPGSLTWRVISGIRRRRNKPSSRLPNSPVARSRVFSLSDPFCVDRHRADFTELIDGHVDILFANEEATCLSSGGDLDEAIAAVTGQCKIAALTRNAEGCVVSATRR